MEKYTTFVTGAPAEALLATLTGTLPAVAMSDAPMDAVNSVEGTNVVGRALPLRCTIDVAEKPVPMSVRTKAPPPALTALGLRLISDGGDSVTL